MSEHQVLTGECAKGGHTVSVHECQACDSHHDGVEIRQLQRQLGMFTHFYTCPTLGDPVYCCLAMLKGGSAIELNGPICNALAEAQLCGRFVVAVGYYDAQGGLRVFKSSHKFPVVDYFETPEHKNFMGNLREIFEREVGQPVPQPMREAPLPKPLVNLLGKGRVPAVEKFRIAQPNGDKEPTGADAGDGSV